MFFFQLLTKLFIKIKNRIISFLKYVLIKIKSVYFRIFSYQIKDNKFINLINLNNFKNNWRNSKTHIDETLLTIIKKRFQQLFKNKSEIIEIIENYGLDHKLNTIKLADNVCMHKIKLFGPNYIDFGKIIDWHQAPITSQKWKAIYWEDLKRSYTNIPEDKFCMELNRHQYLIILAKAFLFTDDEKYVVELFKQISEWMSKNKYLIGINWISSLELSVRIISWTWALYYLHDTNIFKLYAKTVFQMQKYIYLQTKYIEEHMAWRQCPNNHLIGEAAALVIIGIIYDYFKESKKWVDKGLKILEEQIIQQVFNDGIDKEQALDYHRFVLDFYSYIVILCQRKDIVISEILLKKLEKMYEALLYLMRPDGLGPMIGDDDNGRVAKLSEDSGRNFLSALSTGAVLFNRSDMKYVAGDFHEESLWLLGNNGLEDYKNIKAKQPKCLSYEFKQAGIYVMRIGWNKDNLYMVFDCGSQGMGKAGHGHADALSFELFAYGKSLIIDSGTYTYNGTKEWRNYFRGTSAHNTIVVDEVDQAEHLEPYDQFGWKKKADGYNLTWSTSENYDFVSGYHNGYSRLKNPVRHQRDIFFVKPEYWIITDIITGKGFHNYDLLFHLPPGDVSLDEKTKTLRTCNKEGGNILVLTVDSNAIEAEVLRGCTSPIQGWVSYNYGDKKEAPVLKYSIKDEVPLSFITVLYPYKGYHIPEIKIKNIELEHENHDIERHKCRCVQIIINDISDYFFMSFDNNGIKIFEDISTDAEMLYARKTNKNIYTKYFMKNGSLLTVNNITEIKLDAKVSEYDYSK